VTALWLTREVAIHLQLLDLAKENAALKRELRRVLAERVVLEHILDQVLQLLAASTSPRDDRPTGR
jgi:hypothetical protein